MYRESELVCSVWNYLDGIRIETEGKGICACLSGGADSVALLSALEELSSEFGYRLYACHFNHGIRGAEADRDEKFCKDLCAGLGIKIFCGRDDVPAYAALYGKSVEEAARECRYAFFSRILAKRDIDFCATAHNMNDDAETLLMNLCRGSGSNGASSISPRNGSIIRPMLKVPRSKVESYLAAVGREYITDSTNLCDDYTRNYFRHEVLPAIEKVYPNAVAALSSFADSAREDRAYFESVTEGLGGDLTGLPKPLRDRVILRKYKDFTGKIASRQVLNSVSAALAAGGRKVVFIDNGTEAVTDNGTVAFFKRSSGDAPLYDEVLLAGGKNDVLGGRAVVYVGTAEGAFINKVFTENILESANISGNLRVRNRREGDRICIRGVNRSVKKLFIEKGIPKEYRSHIPVILDDMGIIYIPFVGISDRAFSKTPEKPIHITTVLNNTEPERWGIAYEKKKQR